MNAVVNKVISQRSDSVNTTREVRAAYIYFHEKRTKNAAGVPFVYGADHSKAGQPNPRYSAAVMFPKLHADAAQCPNYTFLWGLAVEAARKMWPTNLDASGRWTWPAGASLPIQDGDVPYVSKPKPGVVAKTPEQIAQANAWRRGYWLIEPENFLDPGPQIAKVIGGVETKLPAQNVNGVSQYKSGDWGVINLHAYAYQNKTFGIGFGFNGFCFTREGEAIGASGPKSVEQMFGGVAAALPASGPPALPTSAGAPVSSAPASYAPPPAAPVAPAPPTAAPLPTSTLPTMTSPSSVSPGLPQLPPVPAR